MDVPVGAPPIASIPILCGEDADEERAARERGEIVDGPRAGLVVERRQDVIADDEVVGRTRGPVDDRALLPAVRAAEVFAPLDTRCARPRKLAP
jgi:hypothetical protein